MTPRERIIAAFQHRKPDRTPTAAWIHPVVMERLRNHFGVDSDGQVELKLGIEGWAGAHIHPFFAEFEEKKTPRPGPEPWKDAVWLDEMNYIDEWGVKYRIGESGWYEERVSGPLEGAETVADIMNHPLPEPGVTDEPDGYEADIAAKKAQDLFVDCVISNPYKIAWQLRGMDTVLMDYYINGDLLEALYDRLYAIYTAIVTRATAAGVDMISVIGDIAMQDRVIMGPEPWRQYDKPRLAKLIADCRAINPEVFMFIHSDGNVMELMDDLVEIGFNVVNPIQPECMDPVEVKKRWGDKITIHGGISLQQTLPNGTVDEVREEVENLIKNCGMDGGLVAFPSNVIQPDTSVENIIACFHAARDFKL